MTASSAVPLTGRRVLWVAIGFFGLVFTVNAAFVLFAQATWPGLSTPDAYRRGLAYNATLAQAEAQAALGWRATLGYDAQAAPGALTARVSAGDGQPVTGLHIAVLLRRPGSTDDRTFALGETGPGAYAAPAALAAGRWLAVAEARDSGGTVTLRSEYELTVAP